MPHWVDQLEPWSALHLAWGRVRGRWPAGPVHYLRRRGRVGWLRWLGFQLDPEPTPYALAGMREEGQILYYAIEDRLVEFSERVSRRCRPPRLPDDPELIRHYYRVSCCWGPGWDLLSDWRALRGLAAPADRLHVRGTGLAAELREPGLGVWGHPAEVLALVKEVGGAWLMAACSLLPSRPVQPGPTLAVQAVNGVNTSRTSDFWWLKEAPAFPRDQVMVYFNRPDCPPNEENLAGMAALGVRRWARWSNLRPGPVPWTQAVSLALRATRLLLGHRGLPYGAWEAVASLKLLRWLTAWPAFFRAHGVAAHLHVTSDAKGIAMRLAADRAGVVDVGYQWSCNHFDGKSQNRALPNHLLLAWGDWSRELVECYPLRPERLELIGHHNLNVVDEPMRVRLAALEGELRARTPVLLGVFGNSNHATCYFTPRDTERLYRCALDFALAHPEVGLVLKDKVVGVDKFPALRADFARLQQEGRAVVLERLSRPFEVALLCDACIGLFCNTAVVESALLERPAFFMDPGHLRGEMQPPYGLLAPYVGADEEALTGFLESVRLGEARPWDRAILDRIDPFRDGSGGRRAGEVLRQLLERARSVR